MENESQLAQLDMPSLDPDQPIPLMPEEAIAVQAFQEIQQAEEAAKEAAAAEKPKKLSKREEIEKLIPEGIQLYFDHLTQKPRVGDKVTIRSPKLHDKDNNPIAGKYGVGPIVMETNVKTLVPAKVENCINKVLCENGQELVLRRTGQWDKVEDIPIKKPHKRHIVLFREKYDDISPDLLEKIKQLSNKKRKTEREVKAAENKRSKTIEKKETATKKKKQQQPVKGKPKRKQAKKEAPVKRWVVSHGCVLSHVFSTFHQQVGGDIRNFYNF